MEKANAKQNASSASETLSQFARDMVDHYTDSGVGNREQFEASEFSKIARLNEIFRESDSDLWHSYELQAEENRHDRANIKFVSALMAKNDLWPGMPLNEIERDPYVQDAELQKWIPDRLHYEIATRFIYTLGQIPGRITSANKLTALLVYSLKKWSSLAPKDIAGYLSSKRCGQNFTPGEISRFLKSGSLMWKCNRFYEDVNDTHTLYYFGTVKGEKILQRINSTGQVTVALSKCIESLSDEVETRGALEKDAASKHFSHELFKLLPDAWIDKFKHAEDEEKFFLLPLKEVSREEARILSQMWNSKVLSKRMSQDDAKLVAMKLERSLVSFQSLADILSIVSTTCRETKPFLSKVLENFISHLRQYPANAKIAPSSEVEDLSDQFSQSEDEVSHCETSAE
jgi:hypothetical protein